LPEFVRRAHQSSGRFMALEVPPVGDDAPLGSANFMHAVLSPAREWFIQVPVEIHLKNGVVTRVSRYQNH
jgi:hypothetical protein